MAWHRVSEWVRNWNFLFSATISHPNFSIPPPACCRELLKSSFTSPSLRPSAVLRPSVRPSLPFSASSGGEQSCRRPDGISLPSPPSLPPALLCSAAKSFFLSLLPPRPRLLFFRTSHKNKCTCVQYRYLSRVRLYAKWAVSTLKLELVLRDDHDYDCPVCFHLFRD